MISFVRILGAGIFWWVLLVAEDPVLAGWLILIIGGTDWVDGFLARRWNQVSELGKALDPVAGVSAEDRGLLLGCDAVGGRGGGGGGCARGGRPPPW